MTLAEVLRGAQLILTGGSMYERMRRDGRVHFDPDIAHAALIYDDGARALLETVHREYLEVALRHSLPMLVGASTWRASGERVERSRYRGKEVNQDNVAFVRDLIARAEATAPPRLVMGILGVKGNAYRPGEALDPEAAGQFHAYQVSALTDAAPDLIMAATLPALGEARGIARLLDESGLPYLLSFVVRDDGTLLDGTPIAEAFDRIDAERSRSPVGYFVNCVHPAVLDKALNRSPAWVAERILGLRANTSTLRPEELDVAEELITEEPTVLAAEMRRVQRRHGLKILGGCCGTGADHIDQIALACKEAE